MKLIDRRKLVDDFWKGVEEGSILSYEDTDDLMENAPTVDAVEVVRCIDCKHWVEDQYGCECSFHSKKENEDYPAFAVEMLPNDFCSYGERK